MTLQKRKPLTNEKVKAYFEKKIEEQKAKSLFPKGINQKQKDLTKLRMNIYRSERHLREYKNNSAYDQVRKSPLNLAFVEEPNEHHALMAVAKNGLVIRDCPENIMTEEVCMTAVENNPLALRHIPHYKLTLRMCKTAVSKSEKAFKYVTHKIYLEMLQDLEEQDNA